MNTLKSPFTPEQVQLLNERQCHVESAASFFHPFTCPHRGDEHHASVNSPADVLVATEAGWICPFCGYTQDWVYQAMTEPVRSPLFPDDAGNNRMDSTPSRNLDQAISAFEALYQSQQLSVGKSAAENAAVTRIWETTEVMLLCLRRRRMALLGVETRPGKPMQIDSAWISPLDSLPPIGQLVQVLMHAGRIGNPMHAGFGPDYWVEISSRRDSGFLGGTFVSELVQTGGISHWREQQENAPSL